MVGAYRGSNAAKVEELSGIMNLATAMRNKRIRWAASVYEMHLPELKEIAEVILREVIEEDTQLRWLPREPVRDSVGGGEGANRK